LTKSSSQIQQDGTTFFKDARQRLAWDQFTKLLDLIKKLNSHTMSREETLEKARVLFGDPNKDLYFTFKRLLNRHL
jgi:hypothetical protein